MGANWVVAIYIHSHAILDAKFSISSWEPYCLGSYIDLGAILGMGWKVTYQWHVTLPPFSIVSLLVCVRVVVIPLIQTKSKEKK